PGWRRRRSRQSPGGLLPGYVVEVAFGDRVNHSPFATLLAGRQRAACLATRAPCRDRRRATLSLARFTSRSFTDALGCVLHLVNPTLGPNRQRSRRGVDR